MSAIGMTKVKRMRTKPRKMPTGQRPKSSSELKRYERLSSRTTQKAVDTATIQTEYKSATATARRSTDSAMATGPGDVPMRTKAHATIATPAKKSTMRQGSN